jgi:hypothetical protein
MPNPALVLLLALSSAARPQANQDPAIDCRLSGLGGIAALGRSGVHPDGVNGIALTTTVCNDGSAEVDWYQAMDPRHPIIAFLVVRESAGRLEQISDRSFVKHGFFAANTTGCGGMCQQPGIGQIGTRLGIGCADTYATVNNGDNYWLGPPDEIDPWLGTWEPLCSHFDRGEPPVPPPQDCNGLRSLTRSQADALGPVGHRVRVSDADLDRPGAAYFFQGQYVIATEPEAARENNLGSRPLSVHWNGASWELDPAGALLHGSVLQRWSGAALASNTNGANDGRVYVAVRVTGPEQGFYRYEFALHNRDNARGIGALSIPRCPGARVRNAGFRDPDGDPSNDWTFTPGPAELSFSTGGNPLRWNSIYNFWFESDAAPLPSAVALRQFAPGPGFAAFPVASQAPLALWNAYLGSGCALDVPPSLYAVGSPARALLGNASFGLASAGNVPSEPSILRAGLLPGSIVLQGCTIWMGGFQGSFRASLATADPAGVALHPLPVPSSLALEGLEVHLQAIGRDPGNGVLSGSFELSDGLAVRVGNGLPGCP